MKNLSHNASRNAATSAKLMPPHLRTAHLDGAVDVMWSVEKSETCSTAAIHHMKDAEAGVSWQFRLHPMVLRPGSAERQEVGSATVEIISLPGQVEPRTEKSKARPLLDRTRLLLDIIRNAIDDAGEFAFGDSLVLFEVRALRREKLKSYLLIKGYWDDLVTDNHKRSRLSTDTKTLIARKIIGASPSWYWIQAGASQ